MSRLYVVRSAPAATLRQRVLTLRGVGVEFEPGRHLVLRVGRRFKVEQS